MAFKLGEMFVKIVAKKGNVDADIDQTKRKLEGAGESGNKAGQRISGGLNKASASAEKLQSLVGKILIPVAVFTALKSLVDQFRAATDQAREYGKALDAIGDTAERRLAALRAQVSTDDIGKQLLEIELAARDQSRAVTDRLDTQVKGLDNVFGNLKASVVGLFSDTPQTLSEVTEAAERELDRISRIAVQTRNELLDQASARRRADSANQIKEGRERIAQQRSDELSAIEDVIEAEKLAAETATDRINRDADERLRTLRELAKVTTLTEAGRERVSEAIREVEAMRRRLLREEQQAAKQSAAAIEAAIDRASQRMADKLNDVFESQSGSFGSGINTLVSLTRQLVTEQRVGR